MNDKYLKESIDILNRKFGEPLPTLEDTTRAHSLKKEGGPGSGRKAKPVKILFDEDTYLAGIDLKRIEHIINTALNFLKSKSKIQ